MATVPDISLHHTSSVITRVIFLVFLLRQRAFTYRIGCICVCCATAAAAVCWEIKIMFIVYQSRGCLCLLCCCCVYNECLVCSSQVCVFVSMANKHIYVCVSSDCTVFQVNYSPCIGVYIWQAVLCVYQCVVYFSRGS